MTSNLAAPRGDARLRRWIVRALRSWQLYVLLLPAIAYVLLFEYGTLYGVQIAFKDYSTRRGIWGSSWVGLQHFARFVTLPNFWKYIWNTVAISLYVNAVFPVSVIFSLMLDEVDNIQVKKTVQMITYAPHFLSTVVVCGMLILFCNRSAGILNNVLELLGGERLDILGTPGAFRHLYVWSGVWQNLGWGTIIYMSALAGISPELIEAAKIDGATRLQRIWHVKLPGILPTLTILFILEMGSVMSVGFEKIFLLQNDLNLDVSTVIATYTYEVGIRGGQFSYSSAIGMFNAAVNMATLLIVNRICKMVNGVGVW